MKRGGKEYNKFLRGEKLTRKEAILAQCYICNGAKDGGMDCKGSDCPLYGYMPYKKKRRAKRALTVEAKIKLCKNLEKAREAKHVKEK